MPIKFEKSAFDPVQPRIDGLRIIATRYWPRGLEKAAADLYLPDLAPSSDLLYERQHEGMSHRAFRKQYRLEMKSQKSLIRLLHWMSESGRNITVMCTCELPDSCHRKILARMIDRGV